MLRSVGSLRACRRLYRGIEPMSSVRFQPIQFSSPHTQYRYNSSYEIPDDAASNIATQMQDELLVDGDDQDIRNELLTTGQEVVVGDTVDYAINLSAWHNFYARILTAVHDHGILDYTPPWWAVIVASAIFSKILVGPFMISAAKFSAKMAEEELNVEAISNSFKEEKGVKLSSKHTRELQTKINNFYKSKGIHIGRNLLSLVVSMPVQIYTFYELRAVIYSHYPGMETEGALWFSNLTVPDPLYILPVALTGTTLANVLLGPYFVEHRYGLEVRPLQKVIMKVVGVFMCGVGVFVSFFPAGLQLLIFMNIATTAVLSVLYRIPAFRRLLKLPVNTGLTFSMGYSDPKKISAAFGPTFGKTKPPKLNYVPKKGFFRRVVDYVKG